MDVSYRVAAIEFFYTREETGVPCHQIMAVEMDMLIQKEKKLIGLQIAFK